MISFWKACNALHVLYFNIVKWPTNESQGQMLHTGVTSIKHELKEKISVMSNTVSSMLLLSFSRSQIWWAFPNVNVHGSQWMKRRSLQMSRIQPVTRRIGTVFFFFTDLENPYANFCLKMGSCPTSTYTWEDWVQHLLSWGQVERTPTVCDCLTSSLCASNSSRTALPPWHIQA